MLSKAIIATFIHCFFVSQVLFSENVGLLVMATGKYISFVPALVESAQKHFCTNHNITFYVYTDGSLTNLNNVVCIYQERLGWPFDTMNRFHVYLEHQDLWANQDYLFACDADMLFVGEVGDEILSERVATLHPGFVGRRGTYEINPLSTACIYPNEGQCYFAGGFYGGNRNAFLQILETNVTNINRDLENGITAIWHDESHWNRFCVDHPPTMVLSPSYCYPEQWTLPYPKKLLALDKDHEEMRSTE